ncbi:hypothetical protein ABW20_dc0100234 [Dactylellina cionopaga]|nr:hypothetical protein ABW20_dc0100234 [Dactylellina cionopaga]
MAGEKAFDMKSDTSTNTAAQLRFWKNISSEYLLDGLKPAPLSYTNETVGDMKFERLPLDSTTVSAFADTSGIVTAGKLQQFDGITIV